MRAREVARWPVREGLLAYLDLLRTKAEESYRWECLYYSVIAPWAKNARPPKPPRILHGDNS